MQDKHWSNVLDRESERCTLIALLYNKQTNRVHDHRHPQLCEDRSHLHLSDGASASPDSTQLDADLLTGGSCLHAGEPWTTQHTRWKAVTKQLNAKTITSEMPTHCQHGLSDPTSILYWSWFCEGSVGRIQTCLGQEGS